MYKKKVFFVITIFILVVSVIFFVHKRYNTKMRYDTINGTIVTMDNFYSLLEPIPQELHKRVNNWFTQYPEAKNILVTQEPYLINTGNIYFDAAKFFAFNNIKNVGKLNYVFKLPESDYFLKICGVNNRFLYAMKTYGIRGIVLYLRKMQQEQDGEIHESYEFVSFEKDKKRMQDYFYSCFSDIALNQKLTFLQMKELVYQVAGAMPHPSLKGAVFFYLTQRYVAEKDTFTSQTLKQAFDMVLDYTFHIVQNMCYKKEDFEKKTFVDSYNIAHRVFCRHRFARAIQKYNLDLLEIPPKSYLVNINTGKPDSLVDTDVVLVQEAVKDHIPFKVFLKDKSLFDQVFTYESMMQLLLAMKYAGLWDITGENIHVNKKTKKITYIDFEPKNDTLPGQWFNKNEQKRRINLGYLTYQFVKRFKKGTVQRKAVDDFIKQNEDVDFEAYLFLRTKEDNSYVFNQAVYGIEESLLGKLVNCANLNSQASLILRKAICNKITNMDYTMF